MPNLLTYELNNDRKVCEMHETTDKCNNNPHCRWAYGSCHMALTVDMIVMFVNRISEELANNNLKAFEIMKVGDYFVSDIVNRNNFSYIKGQKIIRASSSNIKKTLQELFGKDNVPNIGRRNTKNISSINYNDINLQNPLLELNNVYIQKIIPNNITLFRAYSNGFYWLKNKYYNIETRNIGYYSQLQTDIATNFKSLVIDWLSEQNNRTKITDFMLDNMGNKKNIDDKINEFINKIANTVYTFSYGITEFLILSQINNNIPIIIKNSMDKIIHIIDNGVYTKNPTDSIISKYEFSKCINLRYDSIVDNSIPDNIEIMYYN